MTERFKKAYDSLVRAFFEGTLAKGTCMACACGNIVADACGVFITKEEFDEHIKMVNKGSPLYDFPKYAEVFNLWIDGTTMCNGPGVPKTGYTEEEFRKIEIAFEYNTKIVFSSYSHYDEQEILEDQYNGLCAVVDVLIKLDKCKEDGTELKKKFREHPKLQLV